MRINADVAPNFAQVDIADALKRRDLTKPIGMLNFLKFFDRVRYEPNGAECPCSGEVAYSRYVPRVKPLLQNRGANAILTGSIWMLGRIEGWVRIFVGRYPRAPDMLSLVDDPEYQKIAHHHLAALEDTRGMLMDFDGSGLS